MSPAYLASRSALIDPDRTMGDVRPGMPPGIAAWNYAPSPFSDLKSTSHFSIADQWGNFVAMTTSVQSTFGSQLMVGGFVLNNQLTDFTDQPEIDGRPVANRPDSGKHPLSSMAPTLVLDGDDRVRLAIGSPGGTRIINYVAEALIAVLDWHMNVQQAVEAPHFVAQGGQLELEQGTDLVELTDALEALGHRVVPRNENSGLHGIAVDYTSDGRVLYGGVDPRREGVALGD